MKALRAAAPSAPRAVDLTKVPFKEMCETVIGVDNMSPPVRAVRIFIRKLVRVVGYSNASAVLSGTLAGRKMLGRGRGGRYVAYLIRVNKLRIDFLDTLSRNDLHGAVRRKIRWAEFAARESMSMKWRWDAKGYLALLARHGFVEGDSRRCAPPALPKTDRTFYIYGPNAPEKPSPKYADATLVLTKPIDVDLSGYRDSILFINSMYYQKVLGDAKLRAELVAKYGRIYVSCRESEMSQPFVRSKFPMGAEIASPMALGRVLYNLMRSFGTFRCVIEGFDLYLQSTAYGAYYPHLARSKDFSVSERVICKALADHDYLYNFLYVKDMVAQLELADSAPFRRIVEMSGVEYVDELAKVRDFRSLR